jgi:hypothetical protein
MTPEQARSAAAIRQTQAVYATEGDRGRVDDLLATFTEEGVLEFHGLVHQGRDAIRAALSPTADARKLEAGRGARVFLRHNLTTSRIEFDVADDAAHAWTYFMVMSPIGLDHTGLYVDRFVRQDERWLIARRRVKINWAAPGSSQARHV